MREGSSSIGNKKAQKLKSRSHGFSKTPGTCGNRVRIIQGLVHVSAVVALLLLLTLSARCDSSAPPRSPERTIQEPSGAVPRPEAKAVTPALPHIVIIVLDTVRASSISILDPEAGAGSLYPIAKNAVVFTHASSTSDYTPPSHYSIFTGYYDGLNTEIDQPVNSVLSTLKSLGYEAIGISANGVVSPSTLNSMKQFDTFVNIWNDIRDNKRKESNIHREKLWKKMRLYDIEPKINNIEHILSDADRVLCELRKELPDHPTSPQFLFLNFMDAHDPYLPPEDFYTLTAKEVPSDLRNRRIPPWDSLHKDDKQLAAAREKLSALGTTQGRVNWKISVDLSPAQLAIYKDRYEAEIRFLVSRLKDVIALLKKRGIYENSIIFITSDHGEEIGESGYLTHHLLNKGDYDATRRVPFLVIPEKKEITAPVVIDEEVSIADIKPTLEALFGIDSAYHPGHRHGRSIAAHLADYSIERIVEKRVDRSGPEPSDTTKELERQLKSLGYID